MIRLRFLPMKGGLIFGLKYKSTNISFISFFYVYVNNIQTLPLEQIITNIGGLVIGRTFVAEQL